MEIIEILIGCRDGNHYNILAIKKENYNFTIHDKTINNYRKLNKYPH